MTEVVAFDDIEALVTAYLRAELGARGDAAKVSTKVPNPRPPRLVRVTRNGGTADWPVTDRPLVVVQCWDAEIVAASDLARLARALLWALPGDSTFGGPVRKVTELAGPAYFPDPTSAFPRYQFSAEVNIRGRALTEE